MNPLESVIKLISPAWAKARLRDRAILAAYEASNPTRTFKRPRSLGSGDTSSRSAGLTMAQQARWYEENYDIAAGVLTTLANNVVGATGIQVEPQPRNRNGEINVDFADEISELWRDWNIHPEVTWEHDGASVQWLSALSWMRDGEVFKQHLLGNVRNLNHGTRVPYSIELIESDLVPRSMSDPGRGLIEGIYKTAWGRPERYMVYYAHPGDWYGASTDTKTIPAWRMTHLKLSKRIGQTRGVSILANSIRRFDDLKKYEDAERIAAWVAANTGFYVRRGTPDMYVRSDDRLDTEGETGDTNNRLLDMSPGMIFDNLAPGEEIGSIANNRPSQLLQPFRDSMLKAIAAGTMSSAATISRNYDGNFSAQRQQLVENWVNYTRLTSAYISQDLSKSYRHFVSTAIAARVLRVPDSIDETSLDDAEYRGPAMPWVDPVKEANAAVIMVKAGFKSRSQVIRERGGNPRAVERERERERALDVETGILDNEDQKDDGEMVQRRSAGGR